MNIIKKEKTNKGITLSALIITIVLMLIIASVTISQLTGKQIIQKADEAKLLVDYKTVKTAIDKYKLGKQVIITDIKNVSDESLIGTVYKKVYIEDTKRELAVIVDFEELDLEPVYGYGGEKLLKDDNNDKTTTKEVETIYDLINIYAVDIEDGNLYYINGEQIYSVNSELVDVQEGENTVKKYAVETVSQEYMEKMKFATKWNVTLGEQEGSATYSTVILPVYKHSIYDATIYWGDGTSTILQHKTNGKTLTDAQIKEIATHNYTLKDNDDGIRTIEIVGTYTTFSMAQTTSAVTKLKLVGIERWGNVGYTNLNLSGCTNLTGSIPEPTKESFASLTTLSFSGCSNLTGKIPANLLLNAPNITSLQFGNCISLDGTIPNGFLDNCVNLQSVANMFSGCTQITSIPVGLFKNCPKLTNVSGAFQSTSITEIPVDLFDTNKGEPNSIETLHLTFYNTKITSIPAGIFDLCTNAKRFGYTGWAASGTFQSCKLLTSIPDNLFYYNTKVTDFSNLFRDCTALEQEIPANLFANCPDAIYFYRTFRNCPKLYGSIPEELFENQNVVNFLETFYGCKGLTGTIPENLFKTCTNATNFQSTFSGCTGLTGKIPENLFKYQTGVTTFYMVFLYCKFEASDVYIASPSVSNFTNAFAKNTDTLINKIYLPANSTTYDTYVAYYGADKVETYEITQ